MDVVVGEVSGVDKEVVVDTGGEAMATSREVAHLLQRRLERTLLFSRLNGRHVWDMNLGRMGASTLRTMYLKVKRSMARLGYIKRRPCMV